MIDWFSGGLEPGMIAIGFVYPYDGPERVSRFKQLLLEKLKFFASVPMTNIKLIEREGAKYGPEFGTWKTCYYEMWYLTRIA